MRRRHFLLFIAIVLLAGFALAKEPRHAGARSLRQAPPIVATVISNNAVELSWSKDSRDLILERRFSDDELFVPLDTLTPKELRFVDSSVVTERQIQYRLRPVDAKYLAEYGPIAVAGVSFSNPPRPRLARVAVDSVNVRVDEWDEFCNTLVIERRIGGLFTPVGQLTRDQTSFLDSGMKLGTYHFYRLRCADGADDSPSSPYDSILMNLSAPTALMAELVNDHSVLLSWTVTMPFACSYDIEKRTPSRLELLHVAAYDTSWVDAELGYEERTYYRLRARHNTDTSDFTPPVSAFYTLRPVDSLRADPAHDLIVNLTWSHPDSLASGFSVERSSDGVSYQLIADLSGRTFAFADTLTSRGHDFYYRVAAKASSGRIAWSQPVAERVPWLEEGMVAVSGDSAHSGFFIDAYEISVQQYVQFCTETKRAIPSDPGFAAYTNYWSRSNHLPAVNVSWLDAIEFCNWRSRSVGVTPVYDATGRADMSANGYRLPSRSEFLAALATVIDTSANLLASNELSACPVEVESFEPRPAHVQHLVGNVWEWSAESVADSARLILGGAYSTPRNLVAGIPEFCYRPDYRSPTLGFRCALPNPAPAGSAR